jgi:phage terminase small subunit
LMRSVSELKAIRNFDVRRLYNPDGSAKHPKDYDDETAAAIQGLDIEQRHSKAPDGTTLTEMVSITKPRSYNKIAAIEQLNRMRNIGVPTKFEVTGKDGAPLIPDTSPSDAEIARRVLFLLTKGAAA